MNKLKLGLLIWLGFMLSWVGQSVSHPVSAAQTNAKVMLVYDSQNVTAEDDQKIDALQRILTGMHLQVRTLKASDYHESDLTTSYQGVITMINWHQAGLKNDAFIKDRDQFKGVKLHIGEGLTAIEKQQLGVKTKSIYQQQLILKADESQQILPFSESIEVLSDVPKHAKTFGKLTTQQTNQASYDYGVVNQKNGYLPYFSKQGLSLLQATALIANLFGQKQQYQPLLTITGVSPYTDLKLLDQLSAYCQKMNIPFAISTVTVAKNTEMKAFQRFAKHLRQLELNHGVIFVQAPVIGGATKQNGTELSELFDSYLLNFAQNQVFPVGISAQGFWNQDQVLHANALQKANYWLMLPNEKVTYLDQVQTSQVPDRSYFAIRAASFNDIEDTANLKFDVPTALTMPMPTSKTKLANLKEQIGHFDFNWENPANNFDAKLTFASSLLGYQQGQYLVNRNPTQVELQPDNIFKNNELKAKPALFKGFFRIQGKIITIFFAVIFTILVVFIFLGRKIYNGMYKR
jgi:uncharacterized protein YdaL